MIKPCGSLSTHSQTVISPAIAPKPKVVVPESLPEAGFVYDSAVC